MKSFEILGMSLVLYAATAASLVGKESDANSFEVPIKEIWALRMPGTRDITALDGGKAYQSLIVPLQRHIRESWNNDRGFAVQGDGLEALKQFYDMEVGNQKQQPLMPNSPASLVFYTRLLGLYAEIHEVAKCENRYTIRYRLTPHKEREATQHMALIPIGNVTPGKYVVRIERLPLAMQFRNLGWPEPSTAHNERICGSFEFIVSHTRQSEAPNDRGAVRRHFALH